jgi:hypothetical protein
LDLIQPYKIDLYGENCFLFINTYSNYLATDVELLNIEVLGSSVVFLS